MLLPCSTNSSILNVICSWNAQGPKRLFIDILPCLWYHGDRQQDSLEQIIQGLLCVVCLLFGVCEKFLAYQASFSHACHYASSISFSTSGCTAFLSPVSCMVSASMTAFRMRMLLRTLNEGNSPSSIILRIVRGVTFSTFAASSIV